MTQNVGGEDVVANEEVLERVTVCSRIENRKG
jgi:hypothetical protein